MVVELDLSRCLLCVLFLLELSVCSVSSYIIVVLNVYKFQLVGKRKNVSISIKRVGIL